MARAVLAIMGIAIIGFMAVFGFQSALAEVGAQTNVTDESWTPTAGSVTELEYSNLDNTYYDRLVEVRDSNDNVMDRGDDYIWYDSNGTIRTVVGGDLDGQSNAAIDYSFRQTSEEQQSFGAVLSMIPDWIGVLLPVLGLLALLSILRS